MMEHNGGVFQFIDPSVFYSHDSYVEQKTFLEWQPPYLKVPDMKTEDITDVNSAIKRHPRGYIDF